MELRARWAYLGPAIGILAGLPLFAAYGVVAPALRAGAAGAPWPGGRTPLNVGALAGALLLGGLWMCWVAALPLRTRVDAAGVHRRGLRGWRTLRWSEVRAVEGDGDAGLVVHGAGLAIGLGSQYHYADWSRLEAYVRERAAAAGANVAPT